MLNYYFFLTYKPRPDAKLSKNRRRAQIRSWVVKWDCPLIIVLSAKKEITQCNQKFESNNQCLYIELRILTWNKPSKIEALDLLFCKKERFIFLIVVKSVIEMVSYFGDQVQKEYVALLLFIPGLFPSTPSVCVCVSLFGCWIDKNRHTECVCVCLSPYLSRSLSTRILWKKKKTFWTLSPIFSPPHTHTVN